MILKILKIQLVLTLLIVIGFAQNNENLEELLKLNPQVQAAEKAFEAAKVKIKSAGVLPDPMLEVTSSIEPIETRNGPIENQIMLGQKFPLWGKLRKERNIQRLNTEITRLNYKNTKVQTAFLLRRYLAEYERYEVSLNILNNYLKALNTFTAIARTQYANGIGKTQHPIIKLQVEEAIVESQINDIESSLNETFNNLKALFNDQLPYDILKNEVIDIDIMNKNRWIEITKQHNPNFLSAQTKLAITNDKLTLTKLKNLPDLTAGLTYSLVGSTELGGTVSSGQDAFGVKVGFNIPLWFGKNRAKVKSASISSKQQEKLLDDTWNTIEADLLSLHKEIENTEQNFAIYKNNILNDSEQMLSSAYAAYATGDLSFLDILDSIRLNFHSKLEYENLKAKRNILKAEFLKTVGLIALN